MLHLSWLLLFLYDSYLVDFLDPASLLPHLPYDLGLTTEKGLTTQWGEKEYFDLKVLLTLQRPEFTGQKSWFALDLEVADFGNSSRG